MGRKAQEGLYVLRTEQKNQWRTQKGKKSQTFNEKNQT